MWFYDEVRLISLGRITRLLYSEVCQIYVAGLYLFYLVERRMSDFDISCRSPRLRIYLDGVEPGFRDMEYGADL